MTKISDLHRRWRKDADYKAAYDALGEEFDLARTLIGLGHDVSVLAPGDDSDGIVEFPDFVVTSGRSFAIS